MQSNNSSQQQQQQQPTYSDSKSTRKYVKTGKYSKKKQQAQQQLHAAIQQQIQAALLQNPQLLSAQQLFQQAVAMANLQNNNGSSDTIPYNINMPPFSNQQLANISTSMLPLASLDSAANSPSASTMTTPTTAMGSPSTAFNTNTLNSPQVQPIHSTTVNTSIPTTDITNKFNTDNNNNNVNEKSIAAMGGIPLQVHMNGLASNNEPIINEALEKQHNEIIKRYTESLQKDHEKITNPDYLTPFKSIEDAMDRLLPYHIYQYPINDLDANKIPMDRQDHTMLDIYKAQVNIFKKYNKTVKKQLKQKKNLENHIMIERQGIAGIRQRVNEEQARVQIEQKAQQQALKLQAEAEKARILQQQQIQLQQQQLKQQQLQQQQLQQQMQQQFQQQHQSHQQMQQQMHHIQQHQLQQQQMQQIQQQQQLQHQQQFLQGQSNANPAAQPFPYEAYAQTLHALMQNKEFAEQYQKLTPELQQQFLRNLNHEKVAEFLKRKNLS
ncbi:unnamed protein product [Cunninghamella blakesleeana]